MSATHARWRDGVLAHNIVDVRHVPGVLNIADGISRQYEGTPKGHGDGSKWTVSPDLDEVTGITHNLFHIEISPEITNLCNRFAEEPFYLEVIDAILELDQGTSIREQKQARHKATQYFIDEGKLWFVGGGPRARWECIACSEAVEEARKEHEGGGHWHCNGIKIALLDQYHSIKLDESIVKAITDCPKCKNFGATHLHSLLNPIMRRHLFELIIGDYLCMPKGKGGYHTVGLYLDTCSCHLWGYKFKTHGSSATTKKSLGDIFYTHAPAKTFMADRGGHFASNEVAEFCEKWGTKVHTVAAYSPWVNGLVEGTNKLLLYVLAWLCAPELGEDGWQAMKKENLPYNWPDHFECAISILNWWILPSLKFTPKELLLGMAVNTAWTLLADSTSILKAEEMETHLAYAAQQRLDSHSEAVRHAEQRKETFDRKVKASRAVGVVFEQGQSVQVHRSDLTTTVSTERKLTPMWSVPHRVVSWNYNSYKLETLEGTPMDGDFSAQ
ncbi:hypothetical protein H0H81_002397 [Sphagnurus paluster]|uniref:Integrase catalytic domain-containing protein n=1 Tax=Sphagnurus paluster TaxID=117069 RepID=A0A9P7KJJ5_9AGAR|nr:hypothetical protein H0H81_002397 [Sphagnurus paluster]